MKMEFFSLVRIMNTLSYTNNILNHGILFVSFTSNEKRLENPFGFRIIIILFI